MEVRDPIHGAMQVSADETRVLDHLYVQRLRNIRQMGFSQLPFPGATHSRYAHSLGVMHVAGKAFDMAYRDWTFSSPAVRERFRATVRLGALCHDLGHAPFSHCTEFAMPHVSALGISFYGSPPDRKATHEDYTIAILERTSLADTIARHAPCTARHVASLISHEVRTGDDFFSDGGFDHRRLLSQIISSELDCDRLDYLVRDAYYSGARYGHVDVNWLLSNLGAYPKDGQVWLSLDSQAIYAFDHFLIARHHMFLMVYFHHKSVVYEEMLKRWVFAGEWSIPGDLEAYLYVDDHAMIEALRASDDAWARRVVERRPYRRVVERHGGPEVDLSRDEERLTEAGLDVIGASSTGTLSRYVQYGRKRATAPSLYVIDRLPGMPAERVQTLSRASRVFERYADERCIARLYVAPEDVDAAREILELPR